MLAISGYGSLASACKQFLGLEYVIKMLNELVNKVLETFINVPEEEVLKDLDVNFPKHVQAIANILAEMPDENVGVDDNDNDGVDDGDHDGVDVDDGDM